MQKEGSGILVSWGRESTLQMKTSTIKGEWGWGIEVLATTRCTDKETEDEDTAPRIALGKAASTHLLISFVQLTSCRW